MQIKLHRGQNQIGGSIIEVFTSTTHIILDIGLELTKQVQTAPQIDGLFCGNHTRYDAVFISHYHSDHIGLLPDLLPDVPIFMGEQSYAVYKYTNEYIHKPVNVKPNFFRMEIPIKIKEITITPFLCDHSAYDSYMFLIECESKKILYTGDFRANGRKSFFRLINRLPKIDILITEGTTLSRNHMNNKTEDQLVSEAIRGAKENYPIFFLQAASNIDRIVTAYKISQHFNLLFLQDIYMGGLTSLIGNHIPNPKNFHNIRVFMYRRGEKEYNKLLEFGSKRIGKAEIATTKFVMCVRPSMMDYLKGLSNLIPFDHAILFYSMWSGYKENDDMKSFISFMENMGVKIYSLHTSGHADAESIDSLIKKTTPQYIIPVHTENAKWFQRYEDIQILLDKTEYEW